MKVRITDLLDEFDDNYGTLRNEQADAEVPISKETITVQQSKHRFGWKQGLSLAAVLGVVVLGGFGVSRMLKARKTPAVTPADSITETQPPETGDLVQHDIRRQVQVPLTDEDQESVNRFLSYLSQQGITEFAPGKMSEYQLVSFAHLYYKINDHDAIAYKTKEVYSDTMYETITLEQANAVVERFFGATLEPVDGTDYTVQNGDNYVIHEEYHDGIFWFPAADGDMHTAFSVCDTVNKTAEGDLEITFTAYDVNNIDDYFDKFETVYLGLRIPEAENLVGEGELYKTMHGSAMLRPTEDGWELLAYEARILEDGPGHREDDEEWPEEYPVENVRVKLDVFTRHGEVQTYRYEPVPMDDGYQIVLHSYAEQVLGCPLSLDQDSPHDGYANWGMEGGDGSAYASGSDITGRFVFNLAPSFDKILEMSETKIEDPDMMQRKAEEFAALFFDITGEITLDHAQEDDCHYHDERSSELRDLTVPAVTFCFRQPEGKLPMLPLQDGYEVPVLCGDSNVLDLPYHCFSVTVWPDGTVVRADNYISCAGIVKNDTLRLPEEADLNRLLVGFITSFAENDTMVVTGVRADQFSVYFGTADIEPAVVVDYYFESAPEEKQSTMFILRGWLEDSGPK